MSRNDAVMKKIPVVDSIDLYEFTAKNEPHQSCITVITQNDHALIIDPTYPEYIARVKTILEQEGKKPAIIVLSHYHPDHVSGCAILPQCKIHASEFYESNHGNCKIWEPDFIYIRPRLLLRDKDTLAFGKFSLKFIHAPGHSKCSLIIMLTDTIVHAGDLIMNTVDNKTSLPIITDGGNFREHITSLEALKALNPETILVPHGGAIKKEDINDMIDDRLYYLKNTAGSRGALPLQKCLKNDISTYDQLEFHDTNLIRLS
ncbi:MAG: MBL fold metallo-hydrolase [bacterium]|nr:MBL fold metallo-hydrolase [bacterium]